MKLGLIWLLISLGGGVFTMLGVITTISDLIQIYKKGKNGQQRRTTLKHLINFLALATVMSSYIILSIEFTMNSYSESSRGILFEIGAALLIMSSVAVSFSSGYSMLGKAEDLRLAKLIDTSGAKYKLKPHLLGVFIEDLGLNVDEDYKNISQEIGNLWDFHVIKTDGITIEKIWRDTVSKEFDAVYIASHCDGQSITLGAEDWNALDFAAFCQEKKTKLVILAVCEGQLFADTLLNFDEIETVIFWLEPLADSDAIKWPGLFFAGLRKKMTVNKATRQAGKMLGNQSQATLRIRGNRNLKI